MKEIYLLDWLFQDENDSIFAPIGMILMIVVAILYQIY